MKLHQLLKCPHCGSDNVNCYSIEEAIIWDDSIHRSFLKSNYLSEDHVVYDAKCENCDKHFNVYLQFKNIEPGDIIISPDDSSFNEEINHRKFDKLSQ